MVLRLLPVSVVKFSIVGKLCQIWAVSKTSAPSPIYSIDGL